LRSTGHALTPEARSFKRPLLGNVIDICVRLDAIGRRVAEEQIHQPGLGGAADTPTPVRRPKPDPDHRAPGPGVRSPLLPVPADIAGQLAIAGETVLADLKSPEPERVARRS